MTGLIEGFVTELRKRGIRVSPAEGIEATRAALEIGIESRSAFRTALAITLAKTLEDQRPFADAFEAYFTPPRLPGRPGRQSEEETGAGGSAGKGRSAGKTGRPAPPSDESRASAPRPIRQPVPREEGGRGGKPDQRRKARGDSPKIPTGEKREPGSPRPRRLILSPARASDGPPPETRQLDLSHRLASEEEARLARQIPAIIREIRLRRGRRFRGGPRGRLWVKRMIRESLAHGGVPFTLPMRERRPRKARVILLVDVSHSTARAAGYFLLICRGLIEHLGRTETYFFVDRIVDATSLVRRWTAARSPAPAFPEFLRSIPDLNLGAPSDYGRVFFQAKPLLGRSAARDSVLVVLGDARSNRRDPLVWAFEDLASRCRSVIWLNAEAHRRWDTGDSVLASYIRACDVVCEARDLDGLARGVREIMRSL